jgi:hypothetical protein
MTRIMVPTMPEKRPNYRQEAENIRAKARETHDAEVRGQLLLIASLYDKLADHLALTLQSRPANDAAPKDPTELTDSA